MTRGVLQGVVEAIFRDLGGEDERKLRNHGQHRITRQRHDGHDEERPSHAEVLDDPRNDERAPSFKDRPPMELARHLEFHDKGNAIVARQILFGIQRLVNRLCYHADQSKDFTELERRLIKARMGLTLGGVSDTLDDLFIAHPELAIGGYGCFDWDRWRQIRDEAEVADFDAGDEDLD